MRNLEKGILLAELVNKDLPSYEQIKNLVAWIREQECYKTLLDNMNEIKNSSTFLAQAIYEEFKAIDLDRVNSIEEGLISYAKILYLCQISTPNFYVNPLLVLNKKERDIRIGDVIVKFNDKYITLEELAHDKDFSFDEKYEFVKKQVDSWQNDVYERIQKPSHYFKTSNPRNLPKIRVMTFFHYVFSFIYLGLIAFVIFGFSTNHASLNTVFKNFDYHQFGPRNYLFLAFLVFLTIGVVGFIIELAISYHKYHKYAKCYKIVIDQDDKLIRFINKNGDHLFDYIIASIERGADMNENVFKFSSCLNIYEYVLYLYHVNYKCKKLKKNKVSHFDFYLIILSLAMLVLTLASIYF